MKRRILPYLAVMWYLAAIEGCSIKENRTVCPCRLILDISSVKVEEMAPVSLSVLSDTGLVYYEILSTAASTLDRVIDVPRTELSVMSWSGYEGMLTDDGLTIPHGRDCPHVYVHSTKVAATGELVRDTVCLRKNHCVLNISFKDTDVPYGLIVRGNVSGYDPEGQPKAGEFYVPVTVDPTSFSSVDVCLPRQIGNDLYLDVSDGEGRYRTFHLSEYMTAAGYDWTEPDLKDLDLLLDYTLTSVTLVIQGWDEEFIFDVVI